MLMMGGLEMINYKKCDNGIETVEIYSDINAQLQQYVMHGNEMVQIYNRHSAN